MTKILPFVNRELVERIRGFIERSEDVFHDPVLESDFCEIKSFFPRRWENPRSIAIFRNQARHYFSGREVACSFYSSGTTSTQRARALFSEEGLNLYKYASLQTFTSILHHHLPKTSPQLWEGVNLIPSYRVLKDSSLAQMLSWFSEKWNVCEWSSFAAKKYDFSNRPIWFFGTTLHWAQVQKSCKENIIFPTDSLLLETGGRKGFQEGIDLGDFSKKLTEYFHLSPKQILQEYSMSELSCQAYTQKKSGQLKFPIWVELRVLISNGRLLTYGEGLLVVYDVLRFDYPWPVITEDYVQLYQDKSFIFLRRKKTAPLRGCSLLANEIIDKSSSENPDVQSVFQKKATKGLNVLSENIGLAHKLLPDMFIDAEWRECLFQEFFDEKIVNNAQDDLRYSFPSSQTKLQKAIEQAIGYKKFLSQNWLIILPGNHSITGLYPLTFAAILGFRCFLKLPKIHAIQNAIRRWYSMLNQHFPQSSFLELPPHWRFHPATKIPSSIDGVLAYGDEETISFFNENIQKTFVGFGRSINISILPSYLFDRYSHLITRDMMSLGGRGCLSTSILIVLENENTSRQKIFDLLNNHLSIYVVPIIIKLSSLEEDLTSTSATTCKVLFINDRIDMKTWLDILLKKLRYVRNITFPNEITSLQKDCLTFGYPHIKQKLIGRSNIQPWDGLYEDRPLFF